MDFTLDEGVAALLGAVVTAGAMIITAVAAAVGSLVTGFNVRRRERASITAAMIAEISALADLIKRRQYREGFADAAQHVRMTGEVLVYSVTVPEHYCRIYAANSGSIGLLPADKAAKVVKFYQLVDSVIQDVKPGGNLAFGSNDPAGFLEAKDLLDEAIGIANALQKAPRWRRFCSH